MPEPRSQDLPAVLQAVEAPKWTPINVAAGLSAEFVATNGERVHPMRFGMQLELYRALDPMAGAA
jgi:hypothetical protein